MQHRERPGVQLGPDRASQVLTQCLAKQWAHQLRRSARRLADQPGPAQRPHRPPAPPPARRSPARNWRPARTPPVRTASAGGRPANRASSTPCLNAAIPAPAASGTCPPSPTPRQLLKQQRIRRALDGRPAAGPSPGAAGRAAPATATRPPAHSAGPAATTHRAPPRRVPRPPRGPQSARAARQRSVPAAPSPSAAQNATRASGSASAQCRSSTASSTAPPARSCARRSNRQNRAACSARHARPCRTTGTDARGRFYVYAVTAGSAARLTGAGFLPGRSPSGAGTAQSRCTPVMRQVVLGTVGAAGHRGLQRVQVAWRRRGEGMENAPIGRGCWAGY